MGGLLHHTLSGTKSYPLHDDRLNSVAVQRVYNRTGTYLLPVAAPEGSPLHPSYGAGHATVAGVCVTILKAWFDESFILSDPVFSNSDGTALTSCVGSPLNVGNELTKLAANISIGRNGLGVHCRSEWVPLSPPVTSCRVSPHPRRHRAVRSKRVLVSIV